VQVIEGLKAGDVVITAGQTKPIMHEGLGVQPLPPGGMQGAPAAGPPKAGAQQPAKKPATKQDG